MVALVAWLPDASAGIKPDVGLAGVLIGMPLTSGETPATSATLTLFSVVLPVTYVDDTGPLRPARVAGSTDVGAGRRGDERERARREIRLCVESIHLVKDAEIVERLTGRTEAQGIAEFVARRRRCGGVDTARD